MDDKQQHKKTNIINKIVLRLLKENYFEFFSFRRSEEYILKNIIYNGLYTTSIFEALHRLHLFSVEKKLREFITQNQSVKQLSNEYDTTIIYNIDKEKLEMLGKYFDKNAIVWQTFVKFSDLAMKIFLDKEKKIGNNVFYLRLDNGLMQYGIDTAERLLERYYLKANFYTPNQFIEKFENIKKEYNNNVKRLL